MSDDNVRVTPVVFCVADFNLSTCESDNLKFLEPIYSTFTVPHEKSKIASLTSLIMKNIAVFPVGFRFPVKCICYITLGLASNACCLLRSIAIKCSFL